MKGKNIFRKIIVSVLILTMVLSNVTVAADEQQGALEQLETQTDDMPAESKEGDVYEEAADPGEDTKPAEKPSVEDGSSGDSLQSPEVTPPADVRNPQDPIEKDPPADTQLEDNGNNTDSLIPPEEVLPPALPAEEELPETDETIQLPEADMDDPDTDDAAEPKEIPAVWEDFEDGMTIAQLAAQPMNGAWATMCLLEEEEPNAWSFDAYYVNDTDRNHVVKTDDFFLKYQMEFHASRTFQEGEVQIRINGILFDNRYSQSITPSDLGVPQAKLVENEEGDLVLQASANRSTPFNYYYASENGEQMSEYCSEETPWLVFYNYKPIASGTNAAWQVLYKDLEIMRIPDETSWTLQPQISVDDEEFDASYTPLTGKVDSSVSLTSVVKTPFYEPGKKYTPGLYTLDQLRNYTDYIDGKYITEEGKLNTDYRYVVWDVKIRGTATQPWYMEFEDIPGTEKGEGYPEVVGYKDHSDTTTLYDIPIQNHQQEAYVGGEKKSWGHRFWVVTAYPASVVEAGNEVKNDLMVHLYPGDGKDSEEVIQATTASWIYKDYDWHYSGNVISVTKKNNWENGDDAVYTGWLEAYKRAVAKGEDYGDLPFKTVGHMRGYETTHYIEGDQLGTYIEGTKYRLTTTDDFMYLSYKEQDSVLTEDDYYFSQVVITQKDYGYDIWEDRRADSERSALIEAGKLDDGFGNIDVYAMFSEPAGGAADEWVQIGSFPMDPSGTTTISLDEIDDGKWLEQKPWRIKVEHDSIDYETECEIKVQVRLKHTSEQLKKITEDRRDGDEYVQSPVIRLENVSGVMGLQCALGGESIVCENIDKDGGNTNYSEPGLKEATEKLYGHLLVRGNAFRDITWLNMTAKAHKEYTSTNDAKNNRVLVDYYLTAYDGYEIYDKSCLDYLARSDQELMSPGRNHVVFYDLLPYGMQFDASAPVTAGRITNLDKNGYYKTQSRSWDTNQVMVTVDPDRDVIPDYRGTGRTMVAFHIAFSGADSTSYTAKKWIEGWGVTFQAYYDWKNMDALNKVDANANLSAFLPDFSVDDPINQINPSLYGQGNEVNCDDGTIVGVDEKVAAMYEDLFAGGGNIDNSDLRFDKYEDSEGVEHWYRNILYAESVLRDNVAVSSESSIQTLVRADEDQYGAFRESTTVSYSPKEPEEEKVKGRYTYEITVNTIKPIKGIIVYDRLECAAEDRSDAAGTDPFDPFGPDWKGTFQAVDLSGLKKQGASATVYYSMNRMAEKTQDLENSSEWYTESEFVEKITSEYGSEVQWTDYVQAVAVQFDPDYELKENQSISFRIQMKAPADKVEENTYAYNNASFYSYPTDQPETGQTVAGDSVRVGIGDFKILEVVKRTAGVIPDECADENFTFRLYDKRNGKSLSFVEYEFWKLVDGTYVRQTERPYATDGDGRFILRADEKAVFRLTDADNTGAEEIENVFWESRPMEKTYRENADGIRIPDAGGDIRVLTVTNVYRPVLYVEKKIMAVPKDADPDTTFTFKIWVESGDTYRPLGNSEYWYVDSMRFNGGIPTRVNAEGEIWTQKDGTTKTRADGTFQIRPGQIIALFPGAAGTRYLVTEEQVDENGFNGDWYCPRPEESGTLISEGSSKTITNYYRYKDLNLTKRLTHQDASECEQEFTFQITELTNVWNEETEKWEQTEAVKTDENGKTVSATAGKEWYLDEEHQGYLDEEGTFTCAFAGQTIRIKGLEANKTYQVKELPIGADEITGVILYQPVKDTEEFTIPPYSTDKNVTFTNDYLKRPLSITKTVSGEKRPEENQTFAFTILVNGEPLPAGIVYTITKEEDEPINGVSDGSGTILLKDGQTVTFQDAGMLGDHFEVTETPDAEFSQLYPAEGGWSGTFSGDGTELTFVNGTANALRISKEYAASEADKTAKDLIEKWKKEMGEWGALYKYEGRDSGNVVFQSPTAQFPRESSAELILEVTDEDGRTYLWPDRSAQWQPVYDSQKQGVWVKGINRCYGGQEVEIFWETGKSIALPPWITLTIPLGDGPGEIPEGASFCLREAETSQHRIVRDDKGNYIQISQSRPSDDGAVNGTAGITASAVIENHMTTLEAFMGSEIKKRMTSASNEVPAGAKLVWRLEQYESGTWKAAEGVSYVVLDEAGESISGEVLTTDRTGEIVLIKTQGQYPSVKFTNAEVYINLYKQEDIEELQRYLSPFQNNLLRLVEVPEKSEKEWGMLAGYGMDMADSLPIWDISPQRAEIIYNSNRNASIEIEKYTEKKSYQEFTMLLKQVTAIDGRADEIHSGNYKEKILQTIPGAGISYTIHNADGSEVSGTRTGTTGTNGEIRLKAGQYVILDVPDGTVWTVSEDTYATQNYDLKDLTPDPGNGKTVKLAENLMLINLPAAVRYTLTYHANGGTGAPDVMTQDAANSSASAVFTISSRKPVKEGYRFLGWAESLGATEASYQPGAKITLDASSGVSKTLYAVWEKFNWTVSYYDGGTLVRTEQVASEETIIISGLDLGLMHPNYMFTGWSDDPDAKTVIYEPGGTLSSPNSSSYNLYAVWEPIPTVDITLKLVIKGIDSSMIPSNAYLEVVSTAEIPGYPYKNTVNLYLRNAEVDSETQEYSWKIQGVYNMDVDTTHVITGHNMATSGYELKEIKCSSSVIASVENMSITITTQSNLTKGTRTITFEYGPDTKQIP